MNTKFQSYSSGAGLFFQLFRICGKNSSHSLNHNTNVVFQFIVKGRGRYFVNNRCYYFSPNCVLVSRPNDNQRCIPERGCYMDKYCLRFPKSIICNYLPGSIYRNLPHVVLIPAPDVAGIKQLLQVVCDEMKHKRSYWHKKMLCAIWCMIIIMARNSRRMPEAPAPYPQLVKAIKHIEKNFRAEINIQSLCKKFGYSASRLSHIFNEETGMGIRHYIIQRRIADSKLLLASRQLKVEAIARQAGYQNTNLFLRQFKSLTKQTPDEYRLALFDDTVSPRPDARIIE